MNTLRRSKTRLCFVLMLAVLGHFGLGHRDVSAFVLCFGADGHVAVESAGHDHGADADQRSASRAETGTYSVPLDSPCTDIPVVGDDHGRHVPLAQASKPSLDLGLLPLVFLAFLLISSARAVLRRLRFPDPPFTDSRLLALRSVVLLI